MEHSLYWENNYLPTCFVEMANEWMILKSYKIKKSTLNKYRYLFNNYIYPQFHTVRIEDINTLTIDRNMYLIYEKYKDILSYSTLKSIIYLIKAVIMYAIKKQYISRIYINFEMAEHKRNKCIERGTGKKIGCGSNGKENGKSFRNSIIFVHWN